MQRKLEYELKGLEKLGIPDDFARLIAYAKFGMTEEANEILSDVKEINDEFEEAIKGMVPFQQTVEERNSENIRIEYHEITEEKNEIIEDGITITEVTNTEEVENKE